MNEINYLTQENTTFYKNKGGLLGLKFKGNDYYRVQLYRSFPFNYPSQFISVRDKEEKEIGIIEDLCLFEEETLTLLHEELDRRYYLPIIDSIHAIKEEFGYGYWDVETNFGHKKFTARRDHNNFINIKDNAILIIDVDGNRYLIEDYTQLDHKSYRLIELMI